MGRKRKKSVSSGFNIEKVIFRFHAPLSTDGSLPRLETLCIPLTRSNGNGGEQLDDKCFTNKIKHKIVDTEEYVCHKDRQVTMISYNDLCQYDYFLSSLLFHT